VRNHAISGPRFVPEFQIGTLALAFFWEILNGSLVLCTQIQNETLGHVTKDTAEGEQEKSTSQTFLTGGKKLVNQVCFVLDVAGKHTTADKFVVQVKRGHHR
jgi:hypothetical protein